MGKVDEASTRQMTDKDVEKLILVTQYGRGERSGRLDASVAKMIDDGLAMYEQELSEVGGPAQWWGGLRRGAWAQCGGRSTNGLPAGVGMRGTGGCARQCCWVRARAARVPWMTAERAMHSLVSSMLAG